MLTRVEVSSPSAPGTGAQLAERDVLEATDVVAAHPRPVSDIAAHVAVSRPAVSQHLKVLKEAGLVTEQVDGTRRIYRLNPVGVGALRDQLDTFWKRALAGYEDVVAKPTEETS